MPDAVLAQPLYVRVFNFNQDDYEDVIVLGTLTDESNSASVTVLGVDEFTSDNQAFHELVVQGASLPAWVDTGCWYTIDGRRDKLHVAQAGAWAGNASLPGGSFTVFTADPRAALTLNMEGWYLQPDVNQQAYARVIAADPNDSTLTVSGNYSCMSVQGKHWRLFAPPGVQTHTAQAGTLSPWVSAVDPRCLFNGYRYESPLAGFYDYPSDTVLYRQIGNNFTGQYYTLHRHYDPYLMRFTSPDPAASPSYNLNAYAGNNPAGAYDPDGLLAWSTEGYWGRVGNMFRGEFEFGLSFDGYGGRSQTTWEGAAVGTYDLVTLGKALDDGDRAALAYRWQGNEFYSSAGYHVAQTTILAAVSIATAGAFSGVGFSGNVAAISLRSFTAAGAITGAWGGAADAGAAGGTAGDMLQSAAIGAAVGAASEVAFAAGGRVLGTVVRTFRAPSSTAAEVAPKRSFGAWLKDAYRSLRLNGWTGRAGAEVDNAIRTGNVEFLRDLKGVGQAQAERLIANPKLATIRGNAIQGRIEQLAGFGAGQRRAFGFRDVRAARRGPDFMALDTGTAWDIHPRAGWYTHELRYMRTGKPLARLFGVHYD